MADIAEGATAQVKGSGSNTYTLKNVGGVYSCSCPAWRNVGGPIDRRTCKHLKAYRGEAVEIARLAAKGTTAPPPAKTAKADGPPLLLAHSWDEKQDPKGWWMSEKLDGVRAFWNGQTFISRLGNPFHAPDWFIAGLPKTPLDGELFGGRKKFQSTVGIVKRQDKSDNWKTLQYVVFDAPAIDGSFEYRLEHVRAVVTGLTYARAHDHYLCTGVAHLKADLAKVESVGGEGLMLRQPGSKYEAGRSNTLLKVKSFLDDEATVIGYEKGKGKHKGRVGSLLVKLANGTEFAVGTGLSDDERKDPPAVGTVITFRYQELSDGGVPRFPSYVGVRAE